jgi:hypothetical protein
MKIGVKRIIALALIAAYIMFVGYGMFVGKDVPEAFIGIVGAVIGYYFGKGSNNNA